MTGKRGGSVIKGIKRKTRRVLKKARRRERNVRRGDGRKRGLSQIRADLNSQLPVTQAKVDRLVTMGSPGNWRCKPSGTVHKKSSINLTLSVEVFSMTFN